MTAELASKDCMVLGSFVGKRILERLPEQLFVAIIEITLIVAGVSFLIHG